MARIDTDDLDPDLDTDAVNALGDQDAENLASDTPAVPESAHELTAENVRRYPDLFTDDEKASFGVEVVESADGEEGMFE